MGQPFVSQQPTEKAGLTGVGPHVVSCEFAVPSDFTGSVHVRLVVHDSVGGTLRFDVGARARVSVGAVVNDEVLDAYREASWVAVADPTFSIVEGALAVTFDGVIGAAVDATTLASGLQT